MSLQDVVCLVVELSHEENLKQSEGEPAVHRAEQRWHLVYRGVLLLNIFPGLVWRDQVCEIYVSFVETVLHIEMFLITQTESFAESK